MRINEINNIHSLGNCLARKVWQCMTNDGSPFCGHFRLSLTADEDQGWFRMQLVVRHTSNSFDGGTSSTPVCYKLCFLQYLSDFSIQSAPTDPPSSSASSQDSTSQPTSFPPSSLDPSSLELVFMFSLLVRAVFINSL